MSRIDGGAPGPPGISLASDMVDESVVQYVLIRGMDGRVSILCVNFRVKRGRNCGGGVGAGVSARMGRSCRRTVDGVPGMQATDSPWCRAEDQGAKHGWPRRRKQPLTTCCITWDHGRCAIYSIAVSDYSGKESSGDEPLWFSR